MTSAEQAGPAVEPGTRPPFADLDGLWERWCAGDEQARGPLLERAAGLAPEQLVPLLVVEQQRRWQAGDRVRAETFFATYRSLKSRPDLAVDLVYAEFLLESDADGAGNPAAYLQRFPELGDDLRRQLDLERGLAAEGPADSVDSGSPTVSDAGLRAPRPASRSPGGEQDAYAFGDYELLEVIAEGGMGIVYKARQRKLNRTVALKMIKSVRLDSAAQVERFYTEARAAARLQHPNIVAVHEVGEHRGQHFFSMDYVAGTTLSDQVRQHALPPRQAAKYLKTIAEAMQYAHERGVLHRDLKPANVLINAADEPLITDFGLAKQVEDDSHLTLEGLTMGTPSYMPPEQARGRMQEVEPRSDVYSLGAILYELLTCRPPFRAANSYETLKQVIDVEPVSPRMLNPGVPRDLETICLKCLQKDKTRRYPSAQELADELGRFLADEPIRARPASRSERAWRWCRRKPALAAALGLAAVGVLGAVVSLSWGYLSTKSALATAQRRLDQTRRAIDELFTLVAEETMLNEPGLQPLRKQLLLKARDLYQDVLAEEGDDPRLRQDLSVSYFRVGRILEEVGSPQEALEPLEKARGMQESLLSQRPDDVPLRSDLANTFNALGTVASKLRRYDDARPWLQRALDGRRELVERTATDKEHSGQLAEHQRKLANVWMNLGAVDERTGALEAARRQMEAAQELRERILQQQPESEVIRRDLAKGYYNLAEVDIALRERAAGQRDQAAFAEQHQRAMQELDRAIDHFTQILRVNPRSLSDQYDAVICHRRKGDTTLQPGEAEQMYDQARQLMQPLAEGNPEVHEYQGRLGGIYLQIGAEFSGRNDERALGAFQTARGILAPLVQKCPNVPDYRADLASTLLEIGRYHFNHQALDEAADALTQSVEQFRELLAGAERATAHERGFAEALGLLAQVCLARGEREKAIASLQQGLRSAPTNQELQNLLKELEQDSRKE